MASIGKIARRGFLLGSVALFGGVAFGYWAYRQPYDNPLKADPAKGEAALTPYILINGDGVTIITPRAEMGQGVYTTLAAMVAEEMEVDVADVNVVHGPASQAYYNAAILEEGVPFPPTDHSWTAETMREFMQVPAKFMGMQMTGGSSSSVDAYEKMRTAGAAAREVLIMAAAGRLGVAAGTLRAQMGAVVADDGIRIPYADLASDAAGIEPPASPELKPSSEWKQLGKTVPRVDMVAKCTGTATYALDVRLDGMLHATVKMNPRLGGEMKSFEASRVEKMPGVKKIVALKGGVAVVATNTWYAFQAIEAIKFDWGAAPYPASIQEQFAAVSDSFSEDRLDKRFRDDGDVDSALQEATVVEAEYQVPYLAHATMEPMTAAAYLRNGKLDVWAGSQFPTQIIVEGETITGVQAENINVHTTYLGGGFGRRADMDFVKHAIEVARAMEGTPIQLTWSREEDMTHDIYRPLAMARFKGTVKDGLPKAVNLDLSTLSVSESQMGRFGIPTPGPDATIVQGAWEQPYDIENYRVTGYRVPAMVPVGFWRSVGASQNGFFHESMIDELAQAADADPLEMRLKMMGHRPSRLVLEAVAQMSKWGSKLPEGHGRGVAYVLSFGVPVAEVIEVANTLAGIKIVKAFAAVDVGTALDPGNIEAQVQSGLNFGLAAAMMGEITVQDGKVEQTNFDTYDAIRINQAPPIEVRILENGERLRGIGEPGTPPAAPALANAIFAATGKRIRELPLNKAINFV